MGLTGNFSFKEETEGNDDVMTARSGKETLKEGGGSSNPNYSNNQDQTPGTIDQ